MASSQNNRDKHICNASDIPGPRRFWTVIVQVLRKDDIKVAKSGKNFQGYVLTDMQGTLVGAVVFEPHIAMFNRIMRPYKRYYLSNASTRPANPDYQVGDYGHSWTLSGLSHVELLEDSIPYTIPWNFNFTRFSELHTKIESNERIAIRCLIVQAIPLTGEGRGADYVLVDEERIPMMIRVWGDLLDNGQNNVISRLPTPTMAVFINMKVTTYHGLSLASKNNTSVFHNPHIANAPVLLEWFEENSEVVAALVRDQAYKNTDILLPLPSPSMIIPVANAVQSLEHIKAAWVSGTLQLLPAQEKLWYTSCRSCNKSVSSYITWEFTCTSCGARAPVQQRCHVSFYLTDDTETMCVTLFSPDAEKLIGYTADQLKEAYEKNVPLINEIEAAVYKKPITCFVKYYEKTYRGSSLPMYPVQKMYLHPVAARESDENIGSPVNAQGSSTSTNATGQSIATETQLFSPSTKEILEQIGANSGPSEPCSGSSVAAKRSLFESLVKTPAIVTASNVAAAVKDKPVFHAINVRPAIETATKNVKEGEHVSGIESPIKKCKNKEKEC